MEQIKAVVLAAGQGKRLHSELYDLPKVLRLANGKPLLYYVLKALDFLPKEDIILVTGYKHTKVEARFPEYPTAFQKEQNGTGDAVKAAVPCLEGCSGSVLVCCGDMPLLTQATYRTLLEDHLTSGNDCTILSGTSALPLHYGRILRDWKKEFTQIIEEKDCKSDAELQIDELNAGVYVFTIPALLNALPKLDNKNNQGEYYLTDVPRFIKEHNGRVGICKKPLGSELIGVNTPEDLALVEMELKKRG